MAKIIAVFRVVHSSGIQTPGPKHVQVERYCDDGDTEEVTLTKLNRDAQGWLKSTWGFQPKLVNFFYERRNE